MPCNSGNVFFSQLNHVERSSHGHGRLESLRPSEPEGLADAVANFLRTEIRNRTLALIKSTDASGEPSGPSKPDASMDFYGAIRNPQRVQRSVDRYERWLTSKPESKVCGDHGLADLIWLCGVVHDVLPDVIEEARKCPDEELKAARLAYAETLYECTIDYIAGVFIKAGEGNVD